MIPDISRLEHMIDACEKIMRFTDVAYLTYDSSDEKKAAVARYFEILGEAANRLSDELKAKHPEVPWKVATALRNALIHDYIKIEYSELWDTAKNDIPLMYPQLRKSFTSFAWKTGKTEPISPGKRFFLQFSMLFCKELPCT